MGTRLHKVGQKVWVTTLIKFRKAIKSWVMETAFSLNASTQCPDVSTQLIKLVPT